MLTRRIIPCLDVIRNRVTKGVKFQNNIDLGDPVEMAARYYEDGCDELVVYDITASAEGRKTDLDMVARVARAVRIPFAVGGGVSSVADMEKILNHLVPENEPYYDHTLEGLNDMPAHAKCSLFGVSLTIPITNGRLSLGTWQGIYLCEFRDYGGERKIVATVYE